MKIIRNLAILAPIILAFACNKEDVPSGGSQDGIPVHFDLTVGGLPMSKTITTDGTGNSRTVSWRENDEVGVFVDSDAAVKLVYGSEKWNGDVKVTAGSHSFYAWYPYNSDVVTAVSALSLEASVLANQNNQYEANSGYDVSDVLLADNTAVEITSESASVALQFSHAFAMVEVLVGGTLVTEAPKSVTLRNIVRTATIDLTSGTVALKDGAGAGNVVMYAVPAEGTPSSWLFRAIVPAQDIAADAMLLEVALAEKTYVFKAPAGGVKYESGKYRRIEAAIGTAPEEIGLTFPAGSVDSWDPSGELPPVVGEEKVVDLVEVKIADLTADGLVQVENYTVSLQNPSNADFLNETKWTLSKMTSENDGVITGEVIDDAGEKAIRMYAEAKAVFGWNKGGLRYHHIGAFEGGYYRLTMKVKNNLEGAPDAKSNFAVIARTAGTTAHESSNGLYFAIKKGTEYDARKYYAASSADWTEMKCYMNFNRAFSAVNLSGAEESGNVLDISADTEAFNWFDLAFLPNSQNAALDLSIKDVSLVKITKDEYDNEK